MNTEAEPRDGEQRAPYEAPAIIYEGELTTRAGTVPGPGAPGADPADIFGG